MARQLTLLQQTEVIDFLRSNIGKFKKQNATREDVLEALVAHNSELVINESRLFYYLKAAKIEWRPARKSSKRGVSKYTLLLQDLCKIAALTGNKDLVTERILEMATRDISDKEEE